MSATLIRRPARCLDERPLGAGVARVSLTMAPPALVVELDGPGGAQVLEVPPTAAGELPAFLAKARAALEALPRTQEGLVWRHERTAAGEIVLSRLRVAYNAEIIASAADEGCTALRLEAAGGALLISGEDLDAFAALVGACCAWLAEPEQRGKLYTPGPKHALTGGRGF